MTRQEFLDSVYDFGALIDFCDDNGYNNCEYIIDRDGIDNYVRDEVDYFSRNYDWGGLEIYLRYLDLSCDWYDTYNVVKPLDDYDFDRYKEEVLAAVDINGDWDDEEDDEEENEDYSGDCDELVSHIETTEEETACDVFGDFFDTFASAFVAANAVATEETLGDIKAIFS